MIRLDELNAMPDFVLILPDETYHMTLGKGIIVATERHKKDPDRGLVLDAICEGVERGDYVIINPNSTRIIETDTGRVFAVHVSDVLAVLETK